MRAAHRLLLCPLGVAMALGCGSGETTTGFQPIGDGGGAAGGAGSTWSGSSTASSTGSTTTDGGDAGPTLDGGPIGGDRPVEVHVPPKYDPAVPTPLVILLHGYGASGALQEVYLQLQKQADERTFLYAYPDGTKDKTGQRFWNATDACCNLYGSDVDDSAYLRGVIDHVRLAYNVDDKRIYLVGHSNGGFMSHRMACDHSDVVAAVATLAGSQWKDGGKCQPQQPVSALVIHGTLDPTINYDGGKLLGNEYPGAIETAQRWAALDGCSTTPDKSAPNIDVGTMPGDETEVWRYQSGCTQKSVVELWTMKGAQHLPAIKDSFREMLVDFLYAHPKP